MSCVLVLCRGMRSEQMGGVYTQPDTPPSTLVIDQTHTPPSTLVIDQTDVMET